MKINKKLYLLDILTIMKVWILLFVGLVCSIKYLHISLNASTHFDLSSLSSDSGSEK